MYYVLFLILAYETLKLNVHLSQNIILSKIIFIIIITKIYTFTV